MRTIDGIASIVITVVLAALVYAGKQYFWPSDKSAEELGYIPGSEAPPWGWKIAIALGVGVCGLLLFGPTMAARWLL